MDHFFSTLDRMDDELDASKAQLTHQLLSWLDDRFCALKGEVAKLRTRARHRIRTSPSAHSKPSQHNGPPIDTVTIDQVRRQEDEELPMDPSNATNSPSTGSKRKQAPTGSATATAKQAKTREIVNNPRGNVASPWAKRVKKYVCQYEDCGQSFILPNDLVRHKRSHLNIRPYSCVWPDCHYYATRKATVVVHIRMKHFKLPQTLKEQAQLNIVDHRDPNDYVRVDEDLAGQRLE